MSRVCVRRFVVFGQMGNFSLRLIQSMLATHSPQLVFILEIRLTTMSSHLNLIDTSTTREYWAILSQVSIDNYYAVLSRSWPPWDDNQGNDRIGREICLLMRHSSNGVCLSLKGLCL